MAKVERTHNYNGEPLKPGEVLVLTPYDNDDATVNCINKENIVTVRVAGRSFIAVLKAVPAEFEAVAKTQFNSWVNSQLPPRRDGRCMLPQPDGSIKECPRKKGSSPACKDCPNKNKFKRKDKAIISIESLNDEYGYTAATIPSLEDEYIDMETLSEAQRVFLRKVEELTEISPKHGLAMLLMALGIKGAEFADKLQLGHDAANAVRKQVADLAPDRVDCFNQIDIEGLKANQSKRSDYYLKEANIVLEIVLKMYFNC